MALLLRVSRLMFSKKKQSMADAFKHFLQHDAGSSIRREPHQKDRKYIHVEITEEFKKQEQSRKQLRLEHIKQRKKLLEQKLTIQSKLLTNEESEQLKNLGQQITSLQTLLEQQERQLAKIETKLEQTEADLILIEGHRKLVVLNKIQYLKHMNMHPSGLVLHPQVMKMIENVHYLVNNNLPVNKFKLFEIMPEIFKTEINELDESIQKLIEEKKIDPPSDPSGRIRFFARHKSRFEDPEQDIIDLQAQRDAVFENMEEEIIKMMDPHMPYVRLVSEGHTPFRDTIHLISVMLSDTINLKFTPEEEALKKTLHEIVELKNKFVVYNEEVEKKVLAMRYKYIQPPVWIKNHPVLFERYQKIMIKYTNPKDALAQLTFDDKPDDGGRAYLSQKLKNLVIQKYHPIVQKLWNEGRKDELIATKKQMEIDFYNESTQILEQYQEMIAQNLEKEEFLKIPKKPRELVEDKTPCISLDDLTKSILVNNSNPIKYNLQFFSKYLGMQNAEEARKLFNSFSYLRVPQQEEKSLQNLKFQILKFRE